VSSSSWWRTILPWLDRAEQRRGFDAPVGSREFEETWEREKARRARAVLLGSADVKQVVDLVDAAIDARRLKDHGTGLGFTQEAAELVKNLYQRAGAAKASGADSVPLLVGEVEDVLEHMISDLDYYSPGSAELRRGRELMRRLYVLIGEAVAVEHLGPLVVARPAIGDGRP
jgi:hypothetical protein